MVYVAKLTALGAATAAALTLAPAALAEDAATTFDVSYPNSEVIAGQTVTVAPVNASSPAIYVVPEDNLDNWDFSINRESGELSVTPAVGLYPGSQLTLSVLAIEEATNKMDLTENITVTVAAPEKGKGLADQASLSYAESTVKPGESVSIPVNGTFPEGTAFIHGNGAEGWVTDTDDKGTLTVTAPAGVADGSWLTANVLVVFPDNSTTVLSVKVTADSTK